MCKHLSLLFILLFPLSLQLTAQVVINEYSAANWKQFEDDHADYEDWIELYNTAVSTVDLSGYGLSDDENEKGRKEFPIALIQPIDGKAPNTSQGTKRGQARETAEAGSGG